MKIGFINGWGYYVYVYITLNHDKETCKVLRIELKEYQHHLIKYFDGKKIAGDIYFEKRENAEKAVEWIESVLVMIEMRDNNE